MTLQQQIKLLQEGNEKGHGDVLRSIYAAAADSRRWEEALQSLGECLDALVVAWADYDFKQQQGNIIHAVGYGPVDIRRYAHGYASLNPWLQSERFYTPGRISVGEEVIENAHLVETKFYREWLQPRNLFHRLCAAVEQEDSRVFYLEALRPRAKGGFSNLSRAFLRHLMPHLQQVLKISHHFWRWVVASETFDRMPFAVVAVDKQGRPLFANRVAEEVLRGQENLCLSSQKLLAKRADIATRLDNLVADTAATSAGKGVSRGGAIMIPRGEGLPLWVIVKPLERRLRHVVGQHDEIALVFVTVPERVGSLSEAALETYYGLTPAEQRVVLLILQGYRLEETAEKLQLSRNTVQWHMKQIYAKTGTDRQADLVRLLLTGPGYQLVP